MNPNACKDEDKVKQVIAMMKVTMMTDDQVQTMIARIHGGGDTKTSDQLRTMITEIQEGGGGEAICIRARARGAGTRTRLRAWGGAVRTRARGVRLAEAPDFSTVVPHTGSACSTPKLLQPARYPVPYHYHERLVTHLRKLEAEGVVERVNPAEPVDCILNIAISEKKTQGSICMNIDARPYNKGAKHTR